MDKLLELISEGPNPRYTMKSVVLSRYSDILKARQLMRTWADIADALGLSRAQWKDLAMAFRRVEVGIKNGKLLAGSGSHVAGSGTDKKAGVAPAAVDYGGFDKPKPKHIFDDDKQGEGQ